MAATRRRRRSAATTMPVNQATPTPQRRQQRAARGRPASTSIGSGISNFFGAVLMPLGNQIVSEAMTYGLPNIAINKLKATFGEVARELVGPEAFSGGTSASRALSVAAVPVGAPVRRVTTQRTTTARGRGGRRAKASTPAGPLTAAQQTALNVISMNEQVSAPIVAARIGQPIRSCLNSLTGLQKRGYLQKGAGKGANAIFWRVQQQQAAAA